MAAVATVAALLHSLVKNVRLNVLDRYVNDSTSTLTGSVVDLATIHSFTELGDSFMGCGRLFIVCFDDEGNQNFFRDLSVVGILDRLSINSSCARPFLQLRDLEGSQLR